MLLFQVIKIIDCDEKATKKKRLENLIHPDISDNQAVLLASGDLMKQRIVVAICMVCGTFTVRLGIDNSARD